MDTSEVSTSTSRWQRVRIVLYFLCACGILYALVPREQRFFYEYQRGKVWTYAPLIAPYDFPLRKPAQELRREYRNIEQKLRPIFVEDTTVAAHVLEELLGQIKSRYATYNDSLLALNNQRTRGIYDSLSVLFRGNFTLRLTELVHYLYRVGIIDTKDVLRSTQMGEFSILRSRIAYETSLTDVYSPRTAAAYLSQEVDKLNNSEEEQLFLSSFNFSKILEPNLLFDSLLTVQLKEEALSNLAKYQGVVKRGERIASTGDLITDEVFQKIDSLRQEMEGRQRHGLSLFASELGYLLLLLAAFSVLYFFLYESYPQVLLRQRETLFLLLLCTLMLGVGFLVVRFAPRFLYLVPLILVPFLVRTFYDARLSLVTHLSVVVTLAFFAPDSYTFTMLHGVAGIVSVLGIKNMTRRGHLFHQVLLVLLSYVTLYGVITFLQDEMFTVSNLQVLFLFAGNALLTLASYQFSYPLERTFGFVSNVTLLELCDTNQPLLRELSSRAPGTFQHAMQVANLAEAAALAIGANSLLIRTGALYHDIGKMLNPEYFVENQTEGMTPHAKLTELQSAEVIIKHVTDGVFLAHKYRLPKQIIDFIRTHHGTTRTEYFYRTYRNNHPDADASIEARFTYPGPRPFSRETALLMMADSIEAASRTLKVITEDTLTALVNKIVEHQQNAQQFDDSDLTLRDIATAKRVFIAKLKNFYHSRIEYPDEVKENKKSN